MRLPKVCAFSLFLAFPGLSQTGAPFALTSQTPANMPDYLFAADVNLDHKMDIVFNSQETADGPVVFLGNGDGTIKFFGNGPNIFGTGYIAVGDVDGDGIPDIVTVQNHNFASGAVTVLHGRGDGTFVQAYQYLFPAPLGLTPGGVFIADLNHDGIPDIITDDFFAGYLYVFLGAGGGTFHTPSSYAIPPEPGFIATGDFDGDGNVDIAVAIFAPGDAILTGSVELLFGPGNGTFNTTQTIQTPGLYAFTLAAADFDGDGLTDLAVGGLNLGPPVIIWGSKTHQFAPSEIPGVGRGFCVLAADFDGDGFIDFANMCNAGDIFVNRGGRNFQKAYSFSITNDGWALAPDMNGDGKPDMVRDYPQRAGIDIFLNQISPWTAQLSASLAAITYGEAVTLTADFLPGTNPLQTPTGTVTWMAGNTVLGASQLNKTGSGYTSTFSFSPAPGLYNVTMKCVGAANANTLALNVAKGQSSLTATLAGSIASPGSSISFSASVSAAPPAAGTPTGTVAITDAGVQLGTFGLDATGHVQGTFHESSSGSHTIQLTYSGDANFAPSSTTLTVFVAASVAIVSAADGVPSAAAGSIVSLYGANLSAATATAPSVPLSTQLAGVEVTFIDSTGASFLAPIYLVSPSQINAVVPQVAAGSATVQVTSFGLTQAAGTISIASAAPALFSANATGNGVAAATLLTFDAAGTASSQLVFTCGAAPQSCVAIPLDLSDSSKQYYLVLYGTGLGGTTATALIQGAPAVVSYSGAQGQYPGLDQINVQLPPSFAGAGTLDIAIAAGQVTSNHVNIVVK